MRIYILRIIPYALYCVMKAQRWKSFEISNFCCPELNNLLTIEIKHTNKVQCNSTPDREIDTDKVMNL